MERDLSSYRDPDGYIAYHENAVYRCIHNPDAAILQERYQAFFEEAVQGGLLVPFEAVGEQAEEGSARLKLETLDFVSYPYEWGFAQLKAAALVTLDICVLALKHGLTLKDATAFNVQQHKGQMVFIDHTSFEPSDNTLPWGPYSQFCRHFLVPLLMASYRGGHPNKHFRTYLDGPDIEMACTSLPFWTRFRPALFFHIYLHNFFIKRHQDENADEKPGQTPVKKQGTPGSQALYIEHLKKLIQKIKPPRQATEWGDYYNDTNYDDAAFREKEEIIAGLARGRTYKTIWDIGGNNGHFSRILAEHAETVISMDIDPAAIDANFVKNQELGTKNVYPIVLDLVNPSPALGFGNAERKTVPQRSSPDMVVALALIHHLAVTHNVPFTMQAQYFRDLGVQRLVIEYVGREDSQFQRLLRRKSETYPHYTQDAFEQSFTAHFDIIETQPMQNKHRQLYIMTPKA